jgi:hypothetical protein
MESLGEERRSRGDRREVPAAGTKSEEHLGPVDIGEDRVFREDARPREDRDGFAELADVHAGPPLCEKRPQLELGRTCGSERCDDCFQHFEGLGVLLGLDRGLGARDDALGAILVARGDTGLEEARVDSEAGGEPAHGFVGRAGLTPLDLAQVLLGEPLAGELRLRHPPVDAQLADSVAEARARLGAAQHGRAGLRL